MISLKLILAALVVLALLYLAGLSFVHRHTVIKPENERVLSPCPQKPNCVFSESDRTDHKVEALPLLDGDPQKSWHKLMQTIRQSGGEIVVDDGRYSHAVFTSGIFRFKDDLEVVMNDEKISIRSASRAGTSDFGVNRKRVEEIRSIYTK
jgi:uncharacterized protein (DUF1499 family)